MIWGGAGAKRLPSEAAAAYETAVNREPMTDEVLQGIAQPGTYDTVRRRLQFLAENGLSAYQVKP
jgi:hypothetical protein